MDVEKFLAEIQKYSGSINIELLRQACLFAEKAHAGQKRYSFEDYITHPLSVAYSLLEYSFDVNIIVSAILHDVVEDTEITENEIKEIFGEDICNLVMGVTKLSRYRFLTVEEAKAESFRKFILAFINDIRILIIKLFDRLDNIRTINYIPKIEKRVRIAKETLDIYAPLAQRLSFNKLKDELEDLCFSVIEPQIKNIIIKKTIDLQNASESYLQDVEQHISQLLEKNNISDFAITGRVKEPYSIWRKMQRKQSSFDDIHDVIGFRIIVNEVVDCYRVLHVVHTNYKVIFSRFKDYISYPKPNNYQSIHTCILLDNNKKIEFQIRTKEMNGFANKGIASHWNYKSPTKNLYDLSQYTWLQNLSKILASKDITNEDLYEYSKMEVFNDEVFVLTPKGEVISLQKGATALDFAYSIHSKIGDTCSGVIINGNFKPIFTTLQNGDVVEIITDTEQVPQVYWLSFVKTGIAKISIKKYLNQKYRKEVSEQAYALLSYHFEKESLVFHNELIPKILGVTKIKSEATLLEKIIEGSVSIPEIINRLYPHLKTKKNTYYKNVIETGQFSTHKLSFAECCYPVYNDNIIGVMLPGSILEVHHSDCEISKSYSNNLNIIDIKWLDSAKKKYEYKVKMLIKLMNKNGALAEISKIISDFDIAIFSIEMDNKSSMDESETYLGMVLMLKDIDDINKVINRLTKSAFVKQAQRLIN